MRGTTIGIGALTLVLVGLPRVAESAGSPTSSCCLQVGAQSPALGGNVGVATRTRTALPQTIADDSTAFYWIGTTTNMGEFVQVGWGSHGIGWPCPGDATRAFMFAEMFTPDGHAEPASLSCGSAGTNGTWHVYDTRWTSTVPPFTFWAAEADFGVTPITGYFMTGTAGDTPGAISEMSFAGDTPPDMANDRIGPVRFANHAVQALMPDVPLVPTRQSATPDPPYATWKTSAGVAFFNVGAWDPCAWSHGIRVNTGNDVTVGYGQPCVTAGQFLWGI